MVRATILPTSFIAPVKENEVARIGHIGVVPPKSLALKPCHTIGVACKFGDHPGVNISALAGTPGNKAGAPIHMAGIAVPAPVEISTYISKLGQGHGYNVTIVITYPIEDSVPKGVVFFG